MIRALLLVTLALATPAFAAPARAGDVLPGNVLIADAGNDRVIEVTPDKRVVWEFPVAGSLPPGMTFRYPDDAFFTPDGWGIIVTEEEHHVIVLVDYATRKVVWSYGTPGRPGAGFNHLHTPDDAYVLRDGRVAVADIQNCRVLLLAPPPARAVLRQFGATGRCDRSQPPRFFASPNGATPLPNGDLLITEIRAHAATEITPEGTVVRRTILPARYPSDAQRTSRDTIVVADYVSPGRVIEVDRAGRLLWAYGPARGDGRLDHPSLAAELPSGAIILNDDHNDRVIVLDKATGRILWQYGHRGQPGRGPGYLRDPDGVDVRGAHLHP